MAHAGDPGVIGSTFYIQNQPFTIVGVSPPGFFGDRIDSNPPALWIPLNDEPIIEGETSILKQPETNWLYVLGRVKPGTNPGSLQAKLTSSLRQWLATQEAYTANGADTQIKKQYVALTPGGAGVQNLQQETSSGLHLLMAISGLVLLVACANIPPESSSGEKRATRRAQTSISMALGASRSRLIRQMLVESLLLGFRGRSRRHRRRLRGRSHDPHTCIPRLASTSHPCQPVVGSSLRFAFALSLLTGLIFGIVPAWISSHSDPAEALRGVNRSTRDRAALPQKSLIVLQAALSLVLLVGAGLLTQSLRNLEHQDFGITTANRYVFHFDAAGAGYTVATVPAANDRLEREFSALPGVQSVGVALYSTLEGNNWGEAVYIEGRPAPAPEDNNNSSWDRVSPHFFETIGQPVLRGRGFTEHDTATSRMVAVVSQAFVKKFFPKEDPIGHHFGTFDQKYAADYEIVGIVADAKYSSPREPVRTMYFRPMSQLNTHIHRA